MISRCVLLTASLAALMTNSNGGRALIPAFCGPLFRSNGQGDFPLLD